jgi:hypothetical protein
MVEKLCFFCVLMRLCVGEDGKIAWVWCLWAVVVFFVLHAWEYLKLVLLVSSCFTLSLNLFSIVIEFPYLRSGSKPNTWVRCIIKKHSAVIQLLDMPKISLLNVPRVHNPLASPHEGLQVASQLWKDVLVLRIRDVIHRETSLPPLSLNTIPGLENTVQIYSGESRYIVLQTAR